MNLTIKNIIQKPDLIEVVSSFLHDSEVLQIEFNEKEKSLRFKTSRIYYEGRKELKTFWVFKSVVCPTIETELTIMPIGQSSPANNLELQKLLKRSRIFYFLKLQKELLAIELSGGDIECSLTAETSLSLKDVSGPTNKFEHRFVGSSSKQFNEFDKLAQNSLR